MIELDVAGATEPAIVDDEFADLARYRWRIDDKGRVFRYGDRRVMLSHAIAGEPPRGYGVIHKNRDCMDFRRINLVLAAPENWPKRGKGRKTKLALAAQGQLFQSQNDF